MISQYFEPEPLARGIAFAKELQARGHSVEVLTGFPNYPGGKVYSGYRIRPWTRETIDGVALIRVALYPSHDGSFLKRVLTYASFALSASILGPFLVSSPEVIYVYAPIPGVGLPAMALSFLYRAPYVFDVQDLWPDTLTATGVVKSKWIVILAGLWCKLVYFFAKKVTVISPGFKARLIERRVPPNKIEVIYNWVDDTQVGLAEKDPELSRGLGLDGYFNVVFAGNLGAAQALDTVLNVAAHQLKRNPKIQFIFVGQGIERARLQKRALDEDLVNVKFINQMPLSEIKKVFALASVLLVHLKDTPLFKITIPSKTQAYLASGRPILMAVGGDCDEVMRRAQAGRICAPEDVGAMVKAIEAMALLPLDQREQLGKNGRLFYETELSLKVGTTRFEKLMKIFLFTF